MEASGIDLEDAYDAIEESAAVSPMLRFRRPIYLDEPSQEVTFALALARKDMGLALALSEQYNVPMLQSQTTFDVLKRAETKGFGERDMASIINFMRKENT